MLSIPVDSLDFKRQGRIAYTNICIIMQKCVLKILKLIFLYNLRIFTRPKQILNLQIKIHTGKNTG